jgi:hypothetical protein
MYSRRGQVSNVMFNPSYCNPLARGTGTGYRLQPRSVRTGLRGLSGTQMTIL